MANQPKQKSTFIDDMFALVKGKRKLSLLLLLLGGCATVVTTAVLIGNPVDNPSSQHGTTSQDSSNSQSSNTSVTSGNVIPDWNFANPTVSPEGSSLGASFDFNGFIRYQNDFYLQGGRYFINRTLSTSYEHTEQAFAVYNIRTSEILYEYTFDLGSEQQAVVLDNGVNSNFMTDIIVAFDGDSTIYVAIQTNLPTTIAGSFTPMKTYVTEKYGSVDDTIYEFLLAFDLSDDTTYTILDSRTMTFPDFRLNDILFDNNRLYFSVYFRKGFLENDQFGNVDNVFDFISVPGDFPRFDLAIANDTNAHLYYILEATLDASLLTFVKLTPVASNYSAMIYFEGYRQGYETRYFNEDGEMFIRARFQSGRLRGVGSRDIPTTFDSLETTFLPDNTSILDEIETEVTAAYDTISNVSFWDDLTTISFVVNFYGFFNFESNQIDHAIADFSVFDNVFGATLNLRVDVSRYLAFSKTDSGEMFIIDNTSSYAVDYLNPDDNVALSGPSKLVDSMSILSRFNSETGEKTLVLEYSDKEKVIQGVYEKANGYYLTGSYYETVDNDVAAEDAFLIETDTAFVTQQELILSGSNIDRGVQIALNASGRPIWLVFSNSIDGDFEGLSEDETRLTRYTVSF
jgi:hypothetical protein